MSKTWEEKFPFLHIESGEQLTVQDHGSLTTTTEHNLIVPSAPGPDLVFNVAPDETRTVWKYPVPLEDRFTLKMPIGAQVLCVQIQREAVRLWALVHPGRSMEEREFYAFGTGHPINVSESSLRYVDTYQMLEGALVLHLFEVL